MVTLAHVQEQTAGHAAAIQRHGKADCCQLFGAHGLAQREQHTQLCLHHIVGLYPVHRLAARHGNVLGQRQRSPVDGGKFGQQGIPHGCRLRGVTAQHKQLNVRGPQHLVISRGELFRRQVVHLFQIALLPHACRAVAKEFPVGLMQAVQTLIVDLILQRLFQHLFFNAHSLRVKGPAHKIGMEGRAQCNGCIFPRQFFAFQRKFILDAGDADAQIVAAAHGPGIHREICTVELGQLFGQSGHVRAVGIATLHHKGQKCMCRGGLPLCRKGKMDADAAAVEFFRRVAGKVHARRNESTFQFVPPPCFCRELFIL